MAKVFLSKSRITRLIVIIIGCLLIISLSRNIFRLLGAQKKIKLAQEKVNQLKAEQEALLKKSESIQSEEFIEEQARDKLNLAKEGEAVVILPTEAGQASMVKERKELEKKLAVWQQWLAVFGF